MVSFLGVPDQLRSVLVGKCFQPCIVLELFLYLLWPVNPKVPVTRVPTIDSETIWDIISIFSKDDVARVVTVESHDSIIAFHGCYDEPGSVGIMETEVFPSENHLFRECFALVVIIHQCLVMRFKRAARSVPFARFPVEFWQSLLFDYSL